MPLDDWDARVAWDRLPRLACQGATPEDHMQAARHPASRRGPGATIAYIISA